MTLLDNLPHLGAASRRSRTRAAAGLGGSRDSYSSLFTGRACWRQAASAAEINEFGKKGISVTDKVYFNTDPLLDERDLLIVSDPTGATATKTYEVRTEADPDASAGLGVLFRVMVEEKTTGGTAS